MKKASNAGSFGAPKPLPGQAGYKETETERLKKDADDMEARLLLLQDKMRSQIGEGGAQAGSGKWSSARTDKGSIRAYGKEVNDKVKKKLEATGGGDPAMRSTLSSKRPTKAAEVDFKSKDVSEWAVPDVSAWLTELQLQQYVSAFAQNAIVGSVLVDITAEDLDYMEIKALGHRKILLKGVDDLRRNGKFTPAALGSPQKAPAEILRTASNPNLGDNSDRLLMSTSMQLPGAKKSPTEASQVSNPRGGMVNPADNEPGGLLDEAAERQAFAEAVAEWRRADAQAAAAGTKKPLVIEREYLTDPSSSCKSGAGVGTSFGEEAGGMGMWKNPFAPAASAVEDSKKGYVGGDVLDEAAERKAFQEAVMEWRRGPTTAAPKVSSASNSTSQPKAATTSASATTTTYTARPQPSRGMNDSFESDHGYSSPSRTGAKAGESGTLLHGQLDEAREHEEFVKAVDSWREGKSCPTGTKPTSTAQALADKISLELESAKEAMSQRLQKQREEAEKRIQEANLELKKLRSAKNLRDEESDVAESKSDAYDSKYGGSDEEQDEEETAPFTYSYSSAPSSHLGRATHAAPELAVSPRVISGSAAPTPRVAKEEEDRSAAPSVGVSLVESVLGYQSSSRGEGKNDNEEYYVVE
eukprot:gene21486-24372_t